VERLVNLFKTELLKLKRAKMFLVSLLGVSAAPIISFIAYLDSSRIERDSITFAEFMGNTNLHQIMLTNVLIYGVVTTYLISREYVEDTLKSILTIPVSRTHFLLSKFMLLFIWFMILTFTAWGLTFGFGVIGQMQGISTAVVLESLKQYAIGGSLLFLLSTPVVFVTLLFKNYVPTIIFTAVLTMINLMIINNEYKALYPWSAVLLIAENQFVPEYPPIYSFISIFVTAIAGFAATILYFKKVDI
jgi:bacitracin transport system permease protein